MLSSTLPHVRNLLLLIISVAATLATGTAWAQCYVQPQAGNQTITAPAEIFVAASHPVGEEIGDGYPSHPAYSHAGISCTDLTIDSSYLRPLTEWAEGIYHTNVPGIGIRVLWMVGSIPLGTAVPFTYATGGAVNIDNQGYYVQLIKTGRVTSGTLQPGTYAEIRFNASPIMKLELPPIRIVAGPAFCDMRSMPDLHLGSIPASIFESAEASSAWVEFPLEVLRCFEANSIEASFHGTGHATMPHLFASTGTSTGIGIELQSADGQPAVPGGVPLVFPASTGPTKHPMRARVKRTSEQALAGTVSAAITIQLTYH